MDLFDKRQGGLSLLYSSQNGPQILLFSDATKNMDTAEECQLPSRPIYFHVITAFFIRSFLTYTYIRTNTQYTHMRKKGNIAHTFIHILVKGCLFRRCLFRRRLLSGVFILGAVCYRVV